MTEIRHWIEAESVGHYFFYVFPFALLALFIWLKGRRVRFLIPSLIITVIIVNPFFYQKWSQLGLYAYWRLLWCVPVIPVLAAVVPCLTERIMAHDTDVKCYANRLTLSKAIAMSAIVTAAIALVIISGTFIYHADGGSFKKAENAEKLPKDIVAVADRLLELDEYPRIIADSAISLYIRQYNGNIETLYGRDLYGYILRAGDTAQNINTAVNEGDWGLINQHMVDEDFDFLVTKNEINEDFELVDKVGEYGIYRAIGKPSVIKKRNELGQVISVTTVNEDGVPINGDNNYSTISYEYDDYGRVIREFRTDTEGIGVPNLQGIAGIEKTYDEESHVIMERLLDPTGKPVAGSAGYVEVNRVYSGDNIIRESYFDEAGDPINRIDTGYASVEMEYDENNNRVLERCFDTDGKAVQSSLGYASVKRTYDNNRMISEAYFDENESPVFIAAGYAEKKLGYDEFGNVIAESYYDGTGASVNCINGYASVEQEYDSEKNIIMQRFQDVNARLVVTGAGYAEVRRIYQGEHLTRESYYGEDGKPMLQPAGYCAIEQVWNGNDLYARIYLGLDGFPVNRTDGYARAVWEHGDDCINVSFYDVAGKKVSIDGLNLATDIKGGNDKWSDWVIPRYNSLNACYAIGYVNLGPKVEGDVYSCEVEVEFKNVKATEGQEFWFRTQGEQDGRWFTDNVWNDGLISLKDVPEDGVYTFTVKNAISESMSEVNKFGISFRCDYWASGAYRVRLLKIEKGEHVSEWSPGV